MTTLLTAPAASTVLVLDQSGAATLSEIARASDRPVSTVQRALNGLLKAGVVEREAPRGRFRLAAAAPGPALRQLAQWRLGPAEARAIAGRLRAAHGTGVAPATIGDARIRLAWPTAMRTIVDQFDPAAIVLFGSQARGDARADSDVDLLVVFDTLEDRRETRIRVAEALASMPFAKDVLVATTDELARPTPGTAVARAAREGVVVYER